jgi:hypothetical protein
MKYSSCKEINVLVKSLVGMGWHFRRGSKHGKLCSPSGRLIVTVPGSPSDGRAFRNFKRDVQRAASSAMV